MIGRVKWYNKKLGYGYITELDTAEEYYVNNKEIKVKTDCYRYLKEGEYVEFTEHINQKEKKEATGVTGIKDKGLMCEVEKERAEKIRHNKSKAAPSAEMEVDANE
jgi:cold shock CspA family protein